MSVGYQNFRFVGANIVNSADLPRMELQKLIWQDKMSNNLLKKGKSLVDKWEKRIENLAFASKICIFAAPTYILPMTMTLQIKQRYQTFATWIREGSRPKALLTAEGKEPAAITCLNCGHTFTGNYCPVCGQAASTGRLRLKSMIMDFLSDLSNMDNRIVRTLVELVLRPGYMARNYIVDGKRQTYYKPIALLFLITAAYVLVVHLLFGDQQHVLMDEDAIVDADLGQFTAVIQMAQTVFTWFMENRAWRSLIVVSSMMYPMKWFFRRTPLGQTLSNADYFCLLVFLQCQTLVFAFFTIPIQYLEGNETGRSLFFEICLAVWLLTQFFQIPWRQCLRRYLLCLLSYLSICILVLTIVIVAVILIAGQFGE